MGEVGEVGEVDFGGSQYLITMKSQQILSALGISQFDLTMGAEYAVRGTHCC